MASVEELQEELIRQSSRRLDAEHERAMLEKQWRSSSKELATERQMRLALENEIQEVKSTSSLREKELQEKMDSMEIEVADLSSSLLDQANQKVSEANRRAAATLKLVAERDALIESQAAQLQALKEMVNAVGEASSRNQIESRITRGTFGTHGGARSSPIPGTGSGWSSSKGSTPTTGTPEIISGSTFESRAISGSTCSDADQLSRDLILDLDSYSSPLRPLMRTDIREFNDFLEMWGIEKSAHPRFGKLEAPPWRRPRFVQRALHEDIEATLRLDRTPHMSWLQTRAFMNGVLEQTLVLQPCSQKEYPWRLRPSHPCLLCGENRGSEKYARSYWAITSANAEPIVLDLACVAKAQLSCEFVSFLRYIADMPQSDRKTQIKAWRQCNTLKEQLFWARTGALFPELSDETWEALHDAKYNEFDFDSVGKSMETQPLAVEASKQSESKLPKNSAKNLEMEMVHDQKMSSPPPHIKSGPPSPAEQGSNFQGNSDGERFGTPESGEHVSPQ